MLDLPFTTQLDIQASGSYSGSTSIISGYEALRQSRVILDNLNYERNRGIDCDKQELINLSKEYDSMIYFMEEAGYITYLENVDVFRDAELCVHHRWLYDDAAEADFLTGSLTGSYKSLMNPDNPLTPKGWED